MPLRVLIVEDEPLVAMDLEAVALAAGHQVVGIAARLSDVRALATRAPHLALVDVNLKDGPTGPAAAAHLVNKHRATVVFVTASIEQIPFDFCGAIGAVRKPFTAAAIAEVLDFAAAVHSKAELVEIPAALVLPTNRGRRLV